MIFNNKFNKDETPNGVISGVHSFDVHFFTVSITTDIQLLKQINCSHVSFSRLQRAQVQDMVMSQLKYLSIWCQHQVQFSASVKLVRLNSTLFYIAISMHASCGETYNCGCVDSVRCKVESHTPAVKTFAWQACMRVLL